MRTYKRVLKQVPDSIICDVCGSNCTNDNCGTECAFIDALWGYCSKQDGKKYDIHLCELCFMNTIDHLKFRRDAFNYCPELDALDGVINL